MANQSPSSDGGLGEAVDRDGGGLGLWRLLDIKASGSGLFSRGWKREAVGATRLWREVAVGGARRQWNRAFLVSVARGCENVGGRVIVLHCA